MNTHSYIDRKQIRIIPIVLMAVSMAFLLSVKPVGAQTLASQLEDLKVLNHYFSTALCDGKKIIYVEDPSSGRYVIIKLAAKYNGDDEKLYVNDFALRYFHDDGKEDRAQCKAIGSCETPDLGEYDEFVISNEAGFLKVERGVIYFELIFFVEDDVNKIELYRLGYEYPLTYYLGSDRLYSVYISSNIGNEALYKAKNAIEQGGYLVSSTSTSLSEDEEGITIHYQEQAESQAREISQRLMLIFGKTAKLEEMNLITQNDVVVWLGE